MDVLPRGHGLDGAAVPAPFACELSNGRVRVSVDEWAFHVVVEVRITVAAGAVLEVRQIGSNIEALVRHEHAVGAIHRKLATVLVLTGRVGLVLVAVLVRADATALREEVTT